MPAAIFNPMVTLFRHRTYKSSPNLRYYFAKPSVFLQPVAPVAPPCLPANIHTKTASLVYQARRGWQVHDYQTHLTQFLNHAGYETILAGCQHEADKLDLSVLGYDRILNEDAPAEEYSGANGTPRQHQSELRLSSNSQQRTAVLPFCWYRRATPR